MKNKIVGVLIWILITLAFITTYVVFNNSFRNSLDEHERDKIELFRTEIETSLSVSKVFSEYIFDTLINNDYVLERIDTAYTANQSTQDNIRDELYNYFYDDYQILVDYDYRQLHFHFPDSTSFLRLHRPELYGDSIYDTRYSIRTVNSEFEFIEGFEEGKIYNAYRYVFPLEFENRHIGSVEISISMASVINSLTEVYESDYDFWMKREIVEDKVFPDEQDNYTASSFSEDYLEDIEAFSNIETRNLFESNQQVLDFYSNLNEDILDMIDNNKDFIASVEYLDVTYLVTFVKLYNIEGEHVAYMSSISIDNNVNEMLRANTLRNLLILAVYLIITSILLSLYIHNRTLNRLLMTDQLTQIHNRRKFEYELKTLINKKPFENFCVLMIDIDDFKLVNDTYGHSVGDIILIELASLINNSLNKNGLLARIGGEEFIVLLSRTDEIGCEIVAEIIRKVVAKKVFSNNISITVSIGGYHIKTNLDNIDNIIRTADNAMYEAKKNGKNRFYRIKK